MASFIPLHDDQSDRPLVRCLSRIGPVIVPASSPGFQSDASQYVLLDAPIYLDDITRRLDGGVEKVSFSGPGETMLCMIGGYCQGEFGGKL